MVIPAPTLATKSHRARPTCERGTALLLIFVVTCCMGQAPKRKAPDAAESDAKAVKVTAGDEELAGGSGPVVSAPAPSAKGKGKGKSAPKEDAGKAVPAPKAAGKGKAAPAAAPAAGGGSVGAAGAGAGAGSGSGASAADVHITSSKACQAFKTRVTQLEAAIKAAKPGGACVFCCPCHPHHALDA